MTENNIFSFVKEHVTLSDFVKTLPTLTSITPVGRKKWRCNNVIAGGSNATSMVIDDDAGFFKAFSHDQEHGDVITLYQLTLGNQQDSVASQAAALAQHMGVPVSDELLNNYSTGISRSDMIDAMNTIVSRAHLYLVESDNDDAITCYDYLIDRGMDDELIDAWKLGAFPSSQQDMKDMTSGISTEILQKIGVVSQKNDSFIAMRGRIVFPIFSTKGDAISLSSRAIDGVKTPLDSKYINTSTTDIYDKSSTLYGQHLINKNTHDIIVCEGNMDVIALNDMTDDDSVVAVATCGTALTLGHIQSLSSAKNINSINIMFDSDDAGLDAASKCLWLHNHYDNVFFVPIPSGKDPWDAYQSGYNLQDMFPYKKPLMTACVEHKFSTLNKMNFLSWCADAHATLNFDINKNMLLHDIHDISGLSKRNIISSSATSQEPHSYQGNRDVSYISEDVAYIIPTLLVMDADMRKIVASPVLSSASQEYAMSICGCSTPDDEDVLYAVVSGKRDNVDKNALAYAYSLYPENTEDDYDFSVTAQYLARSLLFSWRYEQKCKPVVSYIPLLQHIASHNSGADGLDQLSFVFEVIAETAMTQ